MVECPHCSVRINIYPEHTAEDYLRCDECGGFFEISSMEPIELKKLFIEECTSCYEDVFIPEEAGKGDLVECASCQVRFEILEVGSPPRIGRFVGW